MANRIQFKRGTRAKIDNIALNTGEPAFSTDTEELFIGNNNSNIRIGDLVFVATYDDLPTSGREDKLYIVRSDSNNNDNPSIYIWIDDAYIKVS
jgi:hypothetical protein